MLILFLRAVFLYIVLIGVMRFLGKRQLGQLEPSEVVVTMVVADLAALPMQDQNISIFSGLLPIFAVLGMEYLLSALSMRSIKLRKLLCGKPVILIENGKFMQDNMRKTRVTMDELISQLREKDVMDLTTVQYAILETGGNLSVFLYTKNRPAAAEAAGISVQEEMLPVTIISDGKIMEDNLKKSGKDRRWLEKTLSQYKTSVKKTFLLTVDSQNKIYFCPKEKGCHK